MTDLTSLTLAEARKGLAAKTFTSLELTDAHLNAIEAARVLNAFVMETPDQARTMAREADARIGKGDAGPLAGIPLGIKDLFATKGVRTTACSKILGNFVPTYESTITSQLWRDGAVMLGKLNNDEFAMGSSNETSCFGPVGNPWRRDGSNTTLVPGGSSGGSASAVAALLCMGATATDTGGSIRQPAAFTATVGIKPTYGRCSRWGIVAFASSLDQAGPIARSTRDAAMLLRSMAGHDPKDTTSVDIPVPDYEAAIGKSVKGMKIGIPREIPSRRHAGRDRKTLGSGRGLAEGGRRRAGRDIAAAYEVRAAGLLHRGAGGGVLQPRALRRRALRFARAGQEYQRTLREHPC
ncbi:Asp-tRNA(Asn)/Glu-tRNA(Gln) amidotransferase A subunit family amidase [Bradyrhizobium sp. LB9.1b]